MGVHVPEIVYIVIDLATNEIDSVWSNKRKAFKWREKFKVKGRYRHKIQMWHITKDILDIQSMIDEF